MNAFEALTASVDTFEVVEVDTGSGSSGGGDGGGGGCFIATAAYGSYLDPKVMILRELRDRYLLPTDLGSKFVDLYYTFSPSIADVISRYEVLKAATRTGLLPLIFFSALSLKFGFDVTLIGLASALLILLLMFSKYKRKSNQIVFG